MVLPEWQYDILAAIPSFETPALEYSTVRPTVLADRSMQESPPLTAGRSHPTAFCSEYTWPEPIFQGKTALVNSRVLPHPEIRLSPLPAVLTSLY
jgi:hypothetical protein